MSGKKNLQNFCYRLKNYVGLNSLNYVFLVLNLLIKNDEITVGFA